MKTFTFSPNNAPREIQDPIRTQVKYYEFFMQTNKLPKDMIFDANARSQTDLNSKRYKAIAVSLSENPEMFHLKNKGIIILASKTEYDKNAGRLTVSINDGQGCVDGGHTYKLCQSKDNDNNDIAYVKISVRIGIPDDEIAHISQGLNTVSNVQDVSILNLQNKFQFIKNRLSDYPYAGLIAYDENSEKPESISTILRVMTCFDKRFDRLDSFPIIAYASLKHCIDRFKTNDTEFHKMTNILPDMLYFYDLIKEEGPKAYNQSKENAKAGNLKFITKMETTLNFLNKNTEYNVSDAFALPLLASMSKYIEDNGEQYRWTESKEQIEKKLRNSLPAAFRTFKDYYNFLKDNVNAAGKLKLVWRSLCQ